MFFVRACRSLEFYSRKEVVHFRGEGIIQAIDFSRVAGKLLIFVTFRNIMGDNVGYCGIRWDMKRRGGRENDRVSEPDKGRKVPKRGEVAFTDADRTRAVTAALATNADKPVSHDALEAARTAIGWQIDQSTLFRWVEAKRDTILAVLDRPTTVEIIRQQANETVSQWQEVRRKTLDILNDESVLKKAAARDLAVIAGISDDHISQATDLPAGVRLIIKAILQEVEFTGLTAEEFLQSILDKLKQKRHAAVVSPVDMPAIEEIEANSSSIPTTSD